MFYLSTALEEVLYMCVRNADVHVGSDVPKKQRNGTIHRREFFLSCYQFRESHAPSCLFFSPMDSPLAKLMFSFHFYIFMPKFHGVSGKDVLKKPVVLSIYC